CERQRAPKTARPRPGQTAGCAREASAHNPAMAKYTLPDLPYDYGALEPHVSGKIMELHHNKHPQTYVNNANETLDALADARAKNDFSKIATLERSLAFNLS